MNFRDVTYSVLCEETKGKNLICIGAGNIFKNIIQLWPADFVNKITYVTDNYKAGTRINIGGKTYDICKVTEITKLDLSNYAIFITTLYCRSVFEQLKKLLMNIDINVYILPVMSRRIDDYTIAKSNPHPVIPKIIHYFWFGKSKMPKEFQKNILTWKKYCPDYEIVRWDETNYDISKCKYMKQAYEAKKWGFVPDYARLDILYQYGGLYFDTDVEILKSFDDLLYEDAFMGFQRDFMLNAGLGFGSAKNNDLICEMRDFYNKCSFINSDGTLNIVASPKYQTEVLVKHGIKLDNTYQKIRNITIFPTDVLDPMGYPYGKLLITNNTHSIHKYSETWIPDKKRDANLGNYKEMDSFF